MITTTSTHGGVNAELVALLYTSDEMPIALELAGANVGEGDVSLERLRRVDLRGHS
ncbi:MAG: hypothetical protein LC777_14420 [Actinobacteria bacterium]|nr:hypothetical protein [Actinomycetota bacterium]